MRTITYKGVEIHILDGIKNEEKLIKNAKEAIDIRLSCPMILGNGPNGKRLIRFTIKKERENLPGTLPKVDVEIGDYVTPIFFWME